MVPNELCLERRSLADDYDRQNQRLKVLSMLAESTVDPFRNIKMLRMYL